MTSTRELIKAGADVNVKNNGGDSPLHAAALQGEIACLRELLEQGADPKVTNKSNKTAKDIALENSKKKCVNLLDQVELIYKEKRLFNSDTQPMFNGAPKKRKSLKL